MVSRVMKSIRITNTREWEEPVESAQVNIFYSNFDKNKSHQPRFKDEVREKEKGKCRMNSPK